MSLKRQWSYLSFVTRKLHFTYMIRSFKDSSYIRVVIISIWSKSKDSHNNQMRSTRNMRSGLIMIIKSFAELNLPPYKPSIPSKQSNTSQGIKETKDIKPVQIQCLVILHVITKFMMKKKF